MHTHQKLLGTCLLALGLFMFTISTVFAASSPDETYKGVVQVIGYENLYGVTPRMIGRGSASMIDHNGHLITNNHVVDDGFGGTLDGFVVCVTKTVGSRPDCHYTASLVARDIEKDIALLRLDSTDIFGSSVDHNSFSTLPLAYEYEPVSQEQVTAIGYPRVGADTITQTVGVIAGTQAYNGATYIKTDALIAGGNSGGPLIRDGKVIGVNTFLLGYEGGLGFALLIGDAQEFIETNLTAPVIGGFDTDRFHAYLAQIEQINTAERLHDNFFALDLSDGYRVTEYEPEKLVVSYQTLPDQTDIQSFMMQRFRTPTLASSQEFRYYIEQYGLYSSSWERMKEVTIGGITMYDIFDKSDPSEGLSRGYKKYVAQLSPNEILFITIQTSTYNESLFQKAKDKLDAFLTTLQFTPASASSLTIDELKFYEPAVSFVAHEQNDAPLNWGGRGIDSMRNMRYSAGVLKNYLGSLHETITVNVYPQTRDLGRGVSIEELMKTRTQDIRSDEKGLITVQGNQGYYYCQPGGAWMYTVQGNYVDGDLCDAVIVIERGADLPYIIEVMLQTETKNSTVNKEAFFTYLQEEITLPTAGDGTTTLGQGGQVESVFQDLDSQHPYFINVINQLVKYKVLIANRPNFEGDMPLTWGDVLKVYLKGVMAVNMDEAAESCGYPVKYDCLFATQKIIVAGEEVAINQMVEALQIDVDAYASADLLWQFDRVADLYLAGIKTVPFTEWHLQTFEDIGEYIYPSERQRLQDREFDTFGKRRVGLGEAMSVDYRRSKLYVYWHPRLGILSEEATSTKPLIFGPTYQRWDDVVGQAIERLCGNSLVCYRVESGKYYRVVTLGELVNYIYPLMDRAKFIPDLEEKKDDQRGGWY